jgi:nitrite reductase/ring-hydroxylating ferredoxin subunit
MSMWYQVATVADLADGEMMAVEADGRELLLARVDDGFYAVDNLCTHAEGWLDMGFLLPESCEVQCPLHEGRFDLRSGKATQEPASEPLHAYKVRVEDGQILVEIQ